MNRLRTARSDEGFTIVELSVTMLITGLVLAMAGTFFANIANLTSWSGADRDATGQSALALDAIRSVVRVATDNDTSPTNTDPAIVIALPSSLTITAYSNTYPTGTAPVKVVFTVNASGQLIETRTAAKPLSGYWAFTGDTTSRLIATGFSVSPSTAFFGYVNASGALLSAPSGLTLAQRKTVTFIRVTTTIDGTNAGGAADPTVLTTSVGMPNLSRDVSATISVPNLPTPVTPTPTPTPTVSTSSPAASPTPTTGSSGSSTSTAGTGSGSATPTTGTGGGTGGTTGGGSGSASATPTATPTPTATATPTPSATPTPTMTTKKPVIG